jgi:hypothetical protein
MIIRTLGRLSLALTLASAVLASISATATASISASATYTDTPVSPGVYQYDLTLNNTGTTTIGTFWFGWIPGAGFLSAAPTGVTNPAGWNDVETNAGAAIQWTTSSLLAPGGSVTGFIFDSTETPTELLGAVPSGLGAGDPVTTSFVYIAAPLADPGFQFVAEPAPIAEGPEPSALTLLPLGLAMLAARRRAKRRG